LSAKHLGCGLNYDYSFKIKLFFMEKLKNSN